MAFRDNEDAYVKTARYAMEIYVNEGRELKSVDDLPESLRGEIPERMRVDKAGVFVSLKINGNLRGCIGTISPATESIAQEIFRNAVCSASEDPRFHPVRPEELPRIDVSVDVLGAPEPIDGPDSLDPRRYGVIVSYGYRRGLLLPDLEGVDTPEEQIDIAARKAGIRKSDPYKLERFEVIRHEAS